MRKALGPGDETRRRQPSRVRPRPRPAHLCAGQVDHAGDRFSCSLLSIRPAFPGAGARALLLREAQVLLLLAAPGGRRPEVAAKAGGPVLRLPRRGGAAQRRRAPRRVHASRGRGGRRGGAGGAAAREVVEFATRGGGGRVPRPRRSLPAASPVPRRGRPGPGIPCLAHLPRASPSTPPGSLWCRRRRRRSGSHRSPRPAGPAGLSPRQAACPDSAFAASSFPAVARRRRGTISGAGGGRALPPGPAGLQWAQKGRGRSEVLARSRVYPWPRPSWAVLPESAPTQPRQAGVAESPPRRASGAPTRRGPDGRSPWRVEQCPVSGGRGI